MYVTELSIRQFRCIARADIDFLHPDSPGAEQLEVPNVNLLTGLNGGGKSTVLKALVAAALGGPIAETEFGVEGWVRRTGDGDCRLRVGLRSHPSDPAAAAEADAESDEAFPLRLTTRIRRGQDHLDVEEGEAEATRAWGSAEAPGFFLAAYGPSRRADAVDADFWWPWIRGPRLERVASLLDEHVPLKPLEAWLPDLAQERPERFEEVAGLLGRAIPPTTRFEGAQEGEHYLFEQDGLAVPYPALSEGIRSHIAWIADLLHHLQRDAAPDTALDDVPGIVLVDEIDQRLHPRWQLDVLSWISAAFPRLQFLVTSHSPLLAGGLRPANIAVLEPDKDADGLSASRPRSVVDDVFGRSADGVLTSSYFDLASTRADPFRKHLRELVRQAREGDADAPLQLMRVLGDPKKMKSSGKKAGGKGGRKKKGGKGRRGRGTKR